jgi:hypothetical protein
MPNTRGKKSAVYGELADLRGNGAPVLVEGAEVLAPIERAGYTPERLDAAIETYIRNAEASGALLLRFAPTLGQMLAKAEEQLGGVLRAVHISPDGEPPPGIPDVFRHLIMTADDLARVLERVAKIIQASSKGADDLTRLRMFVIGGDEDDGGLAGKGENELRRMVLDAASGWQKPAEPA